MANVPLSDWQICSTSIRGVTMLNSSLIGGKPVNPPVLQVRLSEPIKKKVSPARIGLEGMSGPVVTALSCSTASGTP